MKLSYSANGMERLFRAVLTRVIPAGVLAFVLLRPAMLPAQTSVPSAPTAVGTNASPGTNAAAATGGGRRGRMNTLVFPPEETNHLLTLGNRNIGVHDPSTIVKSKDEYWIFLYRSRRSLVSFERPGHVGTGAGNIQRAFLPGSRMCPGSADAVSGRRM